MAEVACSACGGVWWTVAVLIDAGTARVAQHAQTMRCASCGVTVRAWPLPVDEGKGPGGGG